jgi:Uma2 family endonuclease
MERSHIGPPEATVIKGDWAPDQGEWTYEDWLKLPDDGYRYEVINGELFMSPPPSARHQRVLMRLVDHLLAFLRLHAVGEVIVAPVGVRLPNQPVPLQPDIIFVQSERLAIIGEDYIEGAPDLVIEILSPSNWLYDRREKMQVYQEAGIAEYWIVDPRAQTIDIQVLEQGTYLLVGQYGMGEVAPSRAIAGFEVPVEHVFAP